MPEQYYTIPDTADFFAVSRATIYDWIKRGILTPVHLDLERGGMRIPQSEIDRYQRGLEEAA